MAYQSLQRNIIILEKLEHMFFEIPSEYERINLIVYLITFVY